MQTTAPLTTPYKFFFQVRNRPSSSKNLRRIRRRRTGYVVALRILRILVYKALQRTSGWRNIKANMQPRPPKSHLLLSLRRAKLLVGYTRINGLRLRLLQELTPTKPIFELSLSLLQILWLIGIRNISYSQSSLDLPLICQPYHL